MSSFRLIHCLSLIHFLLFCLCINVVLGKIWNKVKTTFAWFCGRARSHFHCLLLDIITQWNKLVQANAFTILLLCVIQKGEIAESPNCRFIFDHNYLNRIFIVWIHCKLRKSRIDSEFYKRTTFLRPILFKG